MFFRLSTLFLFSFLVVLACAAWTTWDSAVESYERAPPFRLSYVGAIHFFVLFAAPAAAIGCWSRVSGGLRAGVCLFAGRGLRMRAIVQFSRT